MIYQYKFQKILQLKEREKEEALSLYQDSVKRFTDAAEKLYELLRKKETLEETQLQQLSKGLSVQKIKHNQLFVTNLEKSIDHAQGLVMKARNTMQWHEEKLKASNIEVKKYEKLKEKKQQTFIAMMNDMENRTLDEFSTQQYYFRGGS